MNSSLLLSILISICSWALLARIFQLWKRKRILLYQDETLLMIFTLSFAAFCAFVCKENLVLNLLFQFAGALVACSVPVFVEKVRRKQLAKNILLGLDSLQMSLKTGRSFSEALAEIIQPEGLKIYGFYFSEACRLAHAKILTPPQSPSPLMKELCFELCELAQSNHRISDSLRAYRTALALQFKMERKCKAATLQARAQSWAMVGLFSLTAVHVLGQYGFKEQQQCFLWSGFLFTIGLIWVQKIGGRIRWKI
jgi:hypothetical protein